MVLSLSPAQAMCTLSLALITSPNGQRPLQYLLRQLASGIANFLFKLITRHGSPAIIQSDQGREFVNEVNKHLFELTGVEHRISAAHHHQTNGLDERFNQTLVNALTKMIDRKPEE